MEPLQNKSARFWLPAQVRTTESISIRIRSSAAEDGRGLQDHIGKLLEWGLEHREMIVRYGKVGLSAHMASQGVTRGFRREKLAKATVSQGVSRRHAR